MKVSNKPCKQGLFVVLEGIDGSGTTSQGQMLVEALSTRGVTALFTHQPSTGPVGRLLRQSLQGQGDAPVDWVTLALLFAADRADHLAREIEPALARGEVVVCDRYDLSSLVYQSATAGDNEEVLNWIGQLNRRARRPDLTLVVNVSPAVALERRKMRGEALELFEKEPLQRKLAKLYQAADKLLPGDAVVHLDGNPSLNVVREAVLQATLQAWAEHPGGD